MALRNAGAEERRRLARLGLLALGILLGLLSARVDAAPVHSPLPDPLHGFALNKACGTAVDGEGDIYVSSAGEGKVEVFDPAGNHLASIADASTPCGLAVDSRGRLYVSERATGEVVQYLPDEYPLSSSPSYGSPAVIDSSGQAKGISVDPSDDRLYVADGAHVTAYEPDGTTGQDEVQQIYIQKGVSGGSFKLKFEGQETAPIAVNLGEAKPTDAEIQTALEALSTVGAGDVEVGEGSRGVRSRQITFTHTLGSKNVPSLQVDSTGLSGGIVVGETPIEGLAFNGHIGEGELSGASAVAAYTYSPGSFFSERRYLFVTDSSNRVKVLSGKAITNLKVSNEIDGKTVPDSEECANCAEGFGPLGAGLAANWATGHVFVYDKAHAVVDEFGASGRYLDQVHSSSFADAEPSGVAVLPRRDEAQELRVEGASGGSFKLSFEGEETSPLAFNASAAQAQAALEALSGIGAGDVAVEGGGKSFRISFAGGLGDRNVAKLTVDDAGLTGSAGVNARVNTLEPGYGPERLYLSSGAGAGARLFGFGSLADPSRKPLPALSHELATARAVAVDSQGDVYAVAGALIHVYDPSGAELTHFEDNHEATDLDVDSTGKVYVLDSATQEVTYYTPSAYPSTVATTYARHEPAVTVLGDLPGGTGQLQGVGVDPANDHVFVTDDSEALELGSAAEGSPIVRKEVAAGLGINSRLDVAVRTADGRLFFATNPEIWAVDPAKGAHGEVVARISGAGSPGGSLGQNPAIAVNQESGHLAVFEPQLGVAQEYEETGPFVAEFGEFTKELLRPKRVAIDNGPSSPNRGSVYIAFDDTKPGTPDIWAFSPLSYGEPPVVHTGVASGLGAGEATLNGTVDPRGFEVTECHFGYTTEEDFQANGFEGAEAKTAACEPEAGEIGKGTKPVAVHADIGGLDPEKRYRFRLDAENEFGSGFGDPGLFGKPRVESERAQPVLYDEATLRATIDPSGVATAYRFEYGPSEAYGQATPAGELAADSGATSVQASLTGLEEGRTYHFRVLAESDAGVVAGPDRSFQTQERTTEPCPNAEFRTGLSANLPDCRAYELVTPAETNGAVIAAPGPGTSSFSFNHWLTVPRGPGAGESLTYEAEPTLPGFEGSGVRDGYRARREPGSHPALGWKNELLSFSHVQGGGDGSEWRGGASDQQYSFWRSRPLSIFEGTLPEGVYLHTSASIAPSPCDPEPQPHFELLGCGSLGPDPAAVPQFVSPGGSHVIFSSKAHLEADAPPEGTTAIYDRAAGANNAQVISLQPTGAGFGAGEDATYVAASEDGAAVLFKVGGNLYLRREGQTFEIAAAPAAFAGVSEDGERVFYAAGAGGAPGPIFACDLQAGPCLGGGEAGLSEIAADGLFVGASPYGSHAFFSSEEALTGGEENDAGQIAQAGQPNLYAWSGGTTRFVAILDPADFGEFGKNPVLNLGGWSAALTAGTISGRGNVPTRATPDGGVFVFQSHAQIGEYANEGKGEIYRYDPAAAGQRLLCLSCDPSGAAPSADAMLEETPALLSNTPLQKKTVIPNVTDDGRRVFFQSSDRLAPGDANSARDVYEWRASGVGACKRTAGCLALISSGQGERDSYLFSMSTDGHDVFIETLDRLLPTDVTGSFSIYDARVEGGIPTTAEPEACHGDACQPPGAGQPPLEAPATTTGSEGNVPKAPACARGKHKVKGRCVAKKRRHAHRRKGHRRGRGK